MSAGKEWPPHARAQNQQSGPQPLQPRGPVGLQLKAVPQPAFKAAPTPPHRPQATPKVLQTKIHGAHAHRPLASAMPTVLPPARPQAPRNVAQLKAAPGRQMPSGLPPHVMPRPEPGRVVQRIAKPPAMPPKASPSSPPTPAQNRPAVVQLAKRTKKVHGLSSITGANMRLASRLETNSKDRPRLMPLSEWQRRRKKHARAGYRKYAAIRHQNLETDTGSEDLMLIVPLRHRSKIGSRRESHYAGIEKRSHKKGQTAQNRTEMVGEVVAATYMEQFAGSACKILFGYGSGGAGIDQLWVNHSKSEYYVVEAKGPGAKLTTNRFAVRGAKKGGGSVTQMSQAWVANRLTRLKSKCPDIFDTLLDDCGLEVNGSFIQRDNTKVASYDIKGLVITAGWDESTGELTHSVSRKNYTF